MWTVWTDWTGRDRGQSQTHESVTSERWQKSLRAISALMTRAPDAADPALGFAPDRRAKRAVAKSGAPDLGSPGGKFIGNNTGSCQMTTRGDVVLAFPQLRAELG